MSTPAPEAIPTEAIAAARAALEQRLSWASLDWPNLYPNMIDAIIGTVVPAAAPLIAAQVKAESDVRITRVFTALSTAVAEGHTYTIAQIQGYVLDANQIEGKSE
jgi:hypothetical protein